MERCACGEHVASFLDSAGEEICLPAWSVSLLNASARCKSACCHILPLVALDGCFMGLNWQPVVIALHCPMRLSHKIVLAVTAILQVCRAHTAQLC